MYGSIIVWHSSDGLLTNFDEFWRLTKNDCECNFRTAWAFACRHHPPTFILRFLLYYSFPYYKAAFLCFSQTIIFSHSTAMRNLPRERGCAHTQFQLTEQSPYPPCIVGSLHECSTCSKSIIVLLIHLLHIYYRFWVDKSTYRVFEKPKNLKSWIDFDACVLEQTVLRHEFCKSCLMSRMFTSSIDKTMRGRSRELWLMRTFVFCPLQFTTKEMFPLIIQLTKEEMIYVPFKEQLRVSLF